MKHSFTDEQLLNLINNTVKRKTEHSVDDFTGGSVQITSTYNHQIAKYKLILFFGYSDGRNSISNQIDIKESEANIYMEALLLKVKSMQCRNNGMDYSELNSLMNNIDNKIEDVEIEDNKIIDIPRTNIVRTSYEHSYKDDVSEIIEYLNVKTNSNYHTSGVRTRKLIQTRFREGFTKENFTTVIDKKVLLWGNDLKMQQYLRPETLFGTKFESYLNEIVSEAKVLSAQGKVSENTARNLQSCSNFLKDELQ